MLLYFIVVGCDVLRRADALRFVVLRCGCFVMFVWRDRLTCVAFVLLGVVICSRCYDMICIDAL